MVRQAAAWRAGVAQLRVNPEYPWTAAEAPDARIVEFDMDEYLFGVADEEEVSDGAESEQA